MFFQFNLRLYIYIYIYSVCLSGDVDGRLESEVKAALENQDIDKHACLCVLLFSSNDGVLFKSTYYT